MRYTTMDVGNIFKSLFRIYKTTKLPMQHHNYTHTEMKLLNKQREKRCENAKPLWFVLPLCQWVQTPHRARRGGSPLC